MHAYVNHMHINLYIWHLAHEMAIQIGEDNDFSRMCMPWFPNPYTITSAYKETQKPYTKYSLPVTILVESCGL